MLGTKRTHRPSHVEGVGHKEYTVDTALSAKFSRVDCAAMRIP
jgi:hypothetical protein